MERIVLCQVDDDKAKIFNPTVHLYIEEMLLMGIIIGDILFLSSLILSSLVSLLLTCSVLRFKICSGHC